MSAKDPRQRKTSERVELRDYGTPQIAVFEGGGVKGFSYRRAIRRMHETRTPDNKTMWENIKYIGGSSAGGITAMLGGLGYHPDVIDKIMDEMDFTRFQDGGSEFWTFIQKNFPNLIDKATGGAYFRGCKNNRRRIFCFHK